jgi:hypothetical protein
VVGIVEILFRVGALYVTENQFDGWSGIGNCGRVGLQEHGTGVLTVQWEFTNLLSDGYGIVRCACFERDYDRI